MSKLRFSVSISLDGYSAGPDQSEENPLGVGGEALHEWVVELAAWRRSHGREGGEENASTKVIEEMQENVGAAIMGRNMFGGGPGPWDEEDPWRGWWGDDPPFGHPVFVLTNHEREPLELTGTTFHFVTDGIGPALERARDVAGDQDVAIGGGAETIRQYLAAGLVDEFNVSITPAILGGGTRLLDGVGELALEQTRAIDAPGVTHVGYRVLR